MLARNLPNLTNSEVNQRKITNCFTITRNPDKIDTGLKQPAVFLEIIQCKRQAIRLPPHVYTLWFKKKYAIKIINVCQHKQQYDENNA